MRIYEIVSEQDDEILFNQESGDDISGDKLDEIAQLIFQGGEVSSDQVQRNLQNSPAISWAELDGNIVGVVALKRPVLSYRDRVFASAGVSDQASKYNLERGYAFVLPEFRSLGIATKLRQMLPTNQPIYVTTRELNTKVNKSLISDGFIQLGEPWISSRGDYNLLLWVKESN